MHCKSCLKEAKYFSTCMHPYCEKCYKMQNLCKVCNHGTTTSHFDNFYKLFNYLNLDKINKYLWKC